MRNIVVFAVVALILSAVCSRGEAIFALDPDKDMKVVKKKVQNEDGTTSIVEEVIITKPGPTVPEIRVERQKPREEVRHSRGLETRLGKYKPKEPMFTVVTTRPDDWPIPERTTKAKAVPTIAETEKNGIGLRWIVWAVCLGIIGYGGFRAFVHMREATSPNKA